MEEFRKIIVALAFSDYSKGIFNYAAGLALKLDSDLAVVHVINSRDVAAVTTISGMGYEVDEEHYIENVKKERKKILDGIIKGSFFPPTRVRAIFKVGNPVDELLKVAVEEKADIIVMGTKGRTDLAHILVGSVAEKVFRHSPVPVISFRDEKTAERMRHRIHMD
jgi:nucleotide-binding universal stress UspA family protein